MNWIMLMNVVMISNDGDDDVVVLCFPRRNVFHFLLLSRFQLRCFQDKQSKLYDDHHNNIIIVMIIITIMMVVMIIILLFCQGMQISQSNRQHDCPTFD